MSDAERIRVLVHQLTFGWTEDQRSQPSLLSQLEQMTYEPASVQASEGSNPNKSASKPPGNMQPLYLVEELRRDLEAYVKRARLMLGYDRRQAVIADTVCGSCGGQLVVAEDASTAVRCVGSPDVPECGTVYERERWLDLL